MAFATLATSTRNLFDDDFALGDYRAHAREAQEAQYMLRVLGYLNPFAGSAPATR
jgi:hypothetical protein